MGSKQGIEMIESPGWRELRLSEMLLEACTHVDLRSREGKGEMQTSLTRFRFDRVQLLGWFWRLFMSAAERDTYGLAFTITGLGHTALDFTTDYPEIEMHCYDPSVISKLRDFASVYQTMTGKTAKLLMEAPIPSAHRKAVLRFSVVALIMLGCYLGFRLLIMGAITRVLSHF